ncbi:NAD(P)H-binding protein [Paenibacillus sp.]|uniref:NAD(P)-dependent oxidoreductase n=1 Tax=Paenibacillus sp. TaxID=58172 RepID=UPI0028B1D0D2|nr:NAD(P)H-binding protein [Paenibacillus sp.]
MNITIFGASGAIGQLLTKLALEQGDIVTAYVRKPTSMTQSHDNLRLIVGQLTEQAKIEQAIANADVVISTLGPAMDTSRKLKGTPIADGHDLIIKTMKMLNKKRFITLATPSIHAGEDRKSISTVLPGIMAKMMFPNAYQDMVKIEQLIKSSTLDWTVVRIINPNAKHKSNSYGISLGDKPAKMSVSRKNIAQFMYSVASEHSYVCQMPIVFNK